MKKLLMIIISLMIPLMGIAAVDTRNYDSIQTKTLAIQGAYGNVLDIAVTPIPSQSTSFMQGMPFNIENSYTWDGVSRYGREIANWTFLANSPFVIKVKAPDMHIEKSNQYYEVAQTLPYILTFTFTPSFTDANQGDIDNITFRFTAESRPQSELDGGEISGSWQLFGAEGQGYEYQDATESTIATFIGSVEGSIFFQFTPEATSRIRNELGQNTSRVPAGNWEADVVLILEVVE